MSKSSLISKLASGSNIISCPLSSFKCSRNPEQHGLPVLQHWFFFSQLCLTFFRHWIPSFWIILLIPFNNCWPRKIKYPPWHLKMDGWNTCFLFGNPIFRCYASFREGKTLKSPTNVAWTFITCTRRSTQRGAVEYWFRQVDAGKGSSQQVPENRGLLSHQGPGKHWPGRFLCVT